MCIGKGACTCHRMHVVLWGQLVGAGLLPFTICVLGAELRSLLLTQVLYPLRHLTVLGSRF